MAREKQVARVRRAIEHAYDYLAFEIAGPEVFEQLAEVAVRANESRSLFFGREE